MLFIVIGLHAEGKQTHTWTDHIHSTRIYVDTWARVGGQDFRRMDVERDVGVGIESDPVGGATAIITSMFLCIQPCPRACFWRVCVGYQTDAIMSLRQAIFLFMFPLGLRLKGFIDHLASTRYVLCAWQSQ